MNTNCDIIYCIQGVVVLSIALAEEPEDHIQAAAAWSLGQIGRHTPEHSKTVAQANVFPRLLQCYVRSGASEDLQTKVLCCCSSSSSCCCSCCIQFISATLQPNCLPTTLKCCISLTVPAVYIMYSVSLPSVLSQCSLSIVKVSAVSK